MGYSPAHLFRAAMIDAFNINEVMTKYLSQIARVARRVLVNVKQRCALINLMITKRIRAAPLYNYSTAGYMRKRLLLTLLRNLSTRVYTDIGFTLNCTPKCREI